MTRWMKTLVPTAVGLALAASTLANPVSVAQASPVALPQEVTFTAPVADLPIDPGGARFSVSPVAESASGGLKVDFSKTATVKNRKVQFQVWNGTAWANVGSTVKMDKKGIALLRTTPAPNTSYRAVAVAMTYKKKLKPATATNPASYAAIESKSWDFEGSLGAEWDQRLDAGYNAVGRRCSAPVAGNSVLSGGTYVTLAVTKAPKGSFTDAQLAACVKSINAQKYSKSTKKKLIKKTPVYRNAMLSTQDRYTLSTGIVAARIKFPKNAGMHSGVWLQSVVADSALNASEIDMIESYGYGKGVTNVVHRNEGKGLVQHKLYSNKMKSSKWWKAYHVFSVEWTRTRIIFRIDGKITRAVSFTTKPVDYFLVMSNLSSDWELGRISDKGLPAKMSVDWVKVWKTA